MTLGTFRNMLAGYLGREPGVFIVHSVNLLDRAINQARKWAERQHRFECARESAVIRSVSLTDGGLLSSAVRVGNEGARVNIRTIERAFLPITGTQRQMEVEVWSRDADMRDLGRVYKNALSVDRRELPTSDSRAPFRLVRHNDKVYISPFDSGTSDVSRDVFMDVVAWLPDYVKDHDTDFFLTHCEDFMLMRSLYQLNFLLKEDQRVSISGEGLASAWETVLKVDNDAVSGSSDDNTLD